MLRPLLPLALVLPLGSGCVTERLPPSGQPARHGDPSRADADLDCTGCILCTFEPFPPHLQRLPNVHGGVIEVVGGRATVRLDADSVVLTDATNWSMAIYSAEGYHGELCIDGTSPGCVHGSFAPRGRRGIRVGDRAAEPSRARAPLARPGR